VTFAAVPGLQATQLACPVALWYVPAAQGSHCEPSADEDCPAPHRAHTPAVAAPVAFEAVPGRQIVQLAWPVAFWYVPAAQASHCEPSADGDCPTPQGVHAADPFETVPGAHARQSTAATATSSEFQPLPSHVSQASAATSHGVSAAELARILFPWSHSQITSDVGPLLIGWLQLSSD
jgi:hypothetical protein